MEKYRKQYYEWKKKKMSEIFKQKRNIVGFYMMISFFCQEIKQERDTFPLLK